MPGKLRGNPGKESLRSHSSEGQNALEKPNALFSSEQGNLIRSSVFRNQEPLWRENQQSGGPAQHILHMNVWPADWPTSVPLKPKQPGLRMTAANGSEIENGAQKIIKFRGVSPDFSEAGINCGAEVNSFQTQEKVIIFCG